LRSKKNHHPRTMKLIFINCYSMFFKKEEEISL